MDKIVKEFLREQCTFDENAEIKNSELYKKFGDWYRENYSTCQPTFSWFLKEIIKVYEKQVVIIIKGIKLQ